MITIDSDRPMASAATRLRGKRAAVIVFSYYPSDPRVMRSARAMCRAGMDVDLLCLQHVSGEPRRERIDGVEVFRVALKKRRAGKLAYAFQYLAFLARSFLWLSRRQLTRRYDVVHVHNMPDFLVFCAGVAKALGTRVMLDLHDPTPEVFMSVYGLARDHWLVRLLRFVEKLSIRFADAVLTPNITFRNLFVARSCPPDKIEIVMNSPLEEVFPLREPADKVPSVRNTRAEFVVMYHGTIVERHGLHTAVDAIAQLKGHIPGLRFHIYGEETAYLREQVLPLVARRGLQDRVHYFGQQDQKTVAQAVAGCDLGVVPNLRTVFTEINLPTRIFEYLALGKPVIVPETQGIRDYFNADNVLFFEAGKVESLAARIQWAFEHPEEVQTITRKGQEIYGRHLWHREESRLLNLVLKLAGNA
ncbi:MAG: glycosyltransferase family 4 protein [Verrucomicrobia bacterium]|nr:glycosyltransferase family 4 protein [Verrucomicrobiota bacterium]